MGAAAIALLGAGLGESVMTRIGVGRVGAGELARGDEDAAAAGELARGDEDAAVADGAAPVVRGAAGEATFAAPGCGTACGGVLSAVAGRAAGDGAVVAGGRGGTVAASAPEASPIRVEGGVDCHCLGVRVVGFAVRGAGAGWVMATRCGPPGFSSAAGRVGGTFSVIFAGRGAAAVALAAAFGGVWPGRGFAASPARASEFELRPPDAPSDCVWTALATNPVRRGAGAVARSVALLVARGGGAMAGRAATVFTGAGAESIRVAEPCPGDVRSRTGMMRPARGIPGGSVTA
jgi:hypothetical protein